MTYLAKITKAYQHLGASEVGFVNVQYVCKWTISCKSMYLTLDLSLIANLPSKTNDTIIALSLHERFPIPFCYFLFLLAENLYSS